MWIPHFGYLLWEKGNTPLDLRKKSKEDLEIRDFEVAFILEDPDRREINSSGYTVEKHTRKQTEIKGKEVIENLILFEPNDKGRLQRIRYLVKSDNPQKAVSKIFNNFSHMLSFTTFSFSSPMAIYGIAVLDRKHQVSWEAKPQYSVPEKFILPKGLSFGKEFRSILAIYREGRNSNSPFYRFFCFYKILEGFFERRIIFKQGDVYIKRYSNKYPELKRERNKIDKNLLIYSLAIEKYKELENKTFQQYYEWLNKHHRLLIAHTFPKDMNQEEWLDIDNYEIYTEFAIIGNITDLIVKKLLQDELNLWQNLMDNGLLNMANNS